MSKLFNKYQELKSENPNKLYLLKSGMFYVGLDEDAKKLSELFNFKITNLNDSVTKCGFPESKLDYYTNLLKNCSVDFDIVDSLQEKVKNTTDYLNNTKLKNIITSIKNLDMNTISFEKAFKLLQNYNQELKDFSD